jgi:hypothetical protein
MHLMSVVEYLKYATPEQARLIDQFRAARSFVLDRCEAKLFITERKGNVEVGVYVVQLGLDKYDYVASKHKAPQSIGHIISVDTKSDQASKSYRLFSAQVNCWISAADELQKLEGGSNNGTNQR